MLCCCLCSREDTNASSEQEDLKKKICFANSGRLNTPPSCKVIYQSDKRGVLQVCQSIQRCLPHTKQLFALVSWRHRTSALCHALFCEQRQYSRVGRAKVMELHRDSKSTEIAESSNVFSTIAFEIRRDSCLTSFMLLHSLFVLELKSSSTQSVFIPLLFNEVPHAR